MDILNVRTLNPRAGPSIGIYGIGGSCPVRQWLNFARGEEGMMILAAVLTVILKGYLRFGLSTAGWTDCGTRES